MDGWMGGFNKMQIAAFSTCFYCSIIFVSFVGGLSFGADSLSSGEFLKDGDTLVSSGQSFELGFFSPGSSKNRYLGIWYKVTPETVVWVANRDNPLADSSGVVTVGHEGNLVLLNQSKGVVWSSNSSGLLTNPAARILESGNLVLWDNISSNPRHAYSWQSFDYPCDTLLAGMKLGSNLRTGFRWYLTAWKSMDDPSPSEYTSTLSDEGLPQILILRNGSTKTFRSGIWNGVQFSGLSVAANSISRQMLVDTQTDVYFAYQALNDGIITRISLNEAGMLQRLVSEKESADWTDMYTVPNDPCDNYALCGANGFCRIKRYSRCECLQGFIPKSPQEWQMLYFSGGCTRKVPLNCSKGEGFSKLSRVKLPDLVNYSLNKSMSLEECKVECLKNCSCAAFANSDIRGGGSGCLMWFAELIDVSDFEDASYEQDLYIRLSASELDSFHEPTKKRKLVMTAVASAISGLLFLGITLGIAIWRRGMKTAGLGNDIDLPLFDLDTINAATYNFSPRNLIGAGGFGSVYKGNLSTDQEIAVKRLSKDSGQGLEEFRNEVALIAKLQHRNLVSLLGCCIDRDERMLIYEYMPNKSLNNFIFDHDKRFLLAWDRRFEIIIGIGRGILYLHQDSKLQVVHRDLKTSNILLDANLNPKISDFGLARIFGGNEKEARTRRIIGTYGYMSPEYAFDGKFSVKSDVFSFGVLLLEVVSGKRNRGFYHPSHHHNLLGHAWILWNEHRAFELMDDSLADSSIISQVEKCIHVGLLCVQRFPGDRPTMSSVVFMLANDEAILPHPKPPGFFMERSPTNSGATSSRELNTDNLVTITMPEGR